MFICCYRCNQVLRPFPSQFIFSRWPQTSQVVNESCLQQLLDNFLAFPDSWFTNTSDHLWFNDFLRGNLVSFCILWCSNFYFTQTWYHHSFCLGMEFFCNWTLSTSLLKNKQTVSPKCTNYMAGLGACSPRKHFLKTGPLETPYPAFPKSETLLEKKAHIDLLRVTVRELVISKEP